MLKYITNGHSYSMADFIFVPACLYEAIFLHKALWSGVDRSPDRNEPKWNKTIICLSHCLYCCSYASFSPRTLSSFPTWIFFALHLCPFSCCSPFPLFLHLIANPSCILHCDTFWLADFCPGAASGWQKAIWLSFNGPSAHLGSSVSINRD